MEVPLACAIIFLVLFLPSKLNYLAPVLLLSIKHFPFLSNFLFALSSPAKWIQNGQQQSQKAGPGHLKAILDKNNNNSQT
jgi:hypothetical protein